MTRYVFRALCFMVATALVTDAVSAAGVTVFADGTFNLPDWSITRIQFGNGGQQTESQQLFGGNPDEFLEITNLVFAAPNPNQFSRIVGVYLKNDAVHNPQVDGPITSIRYSEDALLVSGFGNGQGIRPALEQGGNIYLGPLLLSPDFVWTPKLLANLTASSFYLAPEVLNMHPDFSATGAPIKFGFARLNTTPGNSIFIVGGIDNWRVEVTSVPEPSAIAAWGAAVVAIAGVGRAPRHRRCSL
jgi:hypothetical protein